MSLKSEPRGASASWLERLAEYQYGPNSEYSDRNILCRASPRRRSRRPYPAFECDKSTGRLARRSVPTPVSVAGGVEVDQTRDGKENGRAEQQGQSSNKRRHGALSRAGFTGSHLCAASKAGCSFAA